MHKVLFLTAMVVAVAVASVAYAQDSSDTMIVKSAAPAGGTPEKGKPVAPSWSLDVEAPVAGSRGASPLEHDWSWTGITETGKYFKKCTAAEIDAAQSDADCDPKAVMATGSLVAYLGPEGDRATNVTCDKTIKVYNEGAGKANLLALGDPGDCAGVGYLPPIPITWKKKGKTSTQIFVFPDNIVHPLPGLEGSFIHIEYKFLKRVATVGKGKKKHKVGYLTSYGCGKASTRTFTFTSKTANEPAGTTEKVSAGDC
jgi:hypothetical protein